MYLWKDEKPIQTWEEDVNNGSGFNNFVPDLSGVFYLFITVFSLSFDDVICF